jgi:hypothetical protein
MNITAVVITAIICGTVILLYGMSILRDMKKQKKQDRINAAAREVK